MGILSSKNHQNTNSLIEKRETDLADSIRYASYIQQAMLPSQKELNRHFPQNFVLNLPRDIVSGDFYWIYRSKNKIIFCVADCTGHGIPGAFMSVLGISVLNQIVLSHKNISAGSILDLLREHVMKSMHQTGSMGEQQDGMDIALAILDTTNQQLQFAGAFNPLYIVRKGSLTKYNGDRMPIGIDPLEERPFKNHEISIEPEDMIYLFSDGFVDQFGGDEGKKFKHNTFRELLINASELDINVQKETIYETFMNWKGNHPQVDDVLLLGIRNVMD